MGLEEFEKELAEGRAREQQSADRKVDESSEHKHRHRHKHRSNREGREGSEHDRHKRRRDRKDDGNSHRHRKRHRSQSPKREKKVEELQVFDSDSEDEWVEKEANTAPPEEDILDQRSENLRMEKVQRDSWMQEPSALDIDYVQSKKPKAPAGRFASGKDSTELETSTRNSGKVFNDLQRDFENSEEEMSMQDEPAQHEVSYTFGDSGSSWRMTKLKAVYRQAEESGKSVDDVASERYGSLRDFDDAREEERELDRRKTYGKEYVGLEKPSGELFQERKMDAGLRRESNLDRADEVAKDLPQAEVQPVTSAPASNLIPLDATSLNKLKAQLLKARLRKAPNLAQLEGEYERAEQASNRQPNVVVLDKMENRMLASSRNGEVTPIINKRGRERGLVSENDDMSIDDMVRHEKRTRHTAGGEGKALAERIAKDGKFVNDLDYIDDNAQNLSKHVTKSDTQLCNGAISSYHQTQRLLSSCPLCHHEDQADPLPTAPIISLATRTYLTLPTEPELTKYGAFITPIQHHVNLIECDDDEWEEMRNFMKSLTRFYDSLGQGVIFYENAAHMLSRKPHAALNAVPLPRHLADTAPAYFKEAILTASSNWTQHKPIIDTLALSQRPGYGKQAFRKAMVKEMPYFHVFFSLDGGLGHVVEDEQAWPKGDLFAREIIGGMLDVGLETVKKQGRWQRHDKRIEGFRKKWAKWDWTKALLEAAAEG